MNMKSIRLRAHEVQGILDGRQTQTRRIVKAQIDHECWVGTENGPVPSLPDWSKVGIAEGKLWCGNCGWLALNPLGCPYGKTGDVLYVRETWKPENMKSHDEYLVGVRYKADDSWKQIPIFGPVYNAFHAGKGKSWQPSLFMPKEAARIFLRITDIRVERLQDITEEDAKAEGAEPMHHRCGGFGYYEAGGETMECTCLSWDQGEYCMGFKLLWQSINGPDSWQTNPWVWLVTFERIDKPE